MAKNKIHIDALKCAIDEYFSEAIQKIDAKVEDVLIAKLIRIDGIDYVYRKIDFKNEVQLEKLASKKFDEYFSQNEHGTVKLFIEIEVGKWKDCQSNFVKNQVVKEHKKYYSNLQTWIDFLENKFNVIVLFENGKQVKSYYDFFTEIGITNKLKTKGIVINPTHNFEKLKVVRSEIFEEKKDQFIEGRELDKIKTGEFEILCFRLVWLRNELSVIEKWLNPLNESKSKKPSTSNQIEILKYKSFVNSEITKIDSVFNERPFEKVFEKALQFGAVEKPVNDVHKEALKEYYVAIFNSWLSEKKGWQFGNALTYNQLVTKENFIEFLNEENEKKSHLMEQLEREKESWQIGEKKSEKPKSISFTHKQIAIAYCILELPITIENAGEILAKFSNLKSNQKLVASRIYKVAELTKISENKTADTKHLKNLDAAKRLISGLKNKKGIADIDRIITSYKHNYNNKY